MQSRQNISSANDRISFQQQAVPMQRSFRLKLKHLPTEIKVKILESLPGEGVARLSGVNREFRDLATNDDLWKRKCLEEYSDYVTESELSDDLFDWKAKFVESRNLKKREEERKRLEETRSVSCKPRYFDYLGARGRDRNSGFNNSLCVRSDW